MFVWVFEAKVLWIYAISYHDQMTENVVYRFKLSFNPEEIHIKSIFSQFIHLMKIDIVSNCLVVCKPRSNIIYKENYPTYHGLPLCTHHRLFSLCVLYTLDSIWFDVSKNIFYVPWWIYKTIPYSLERIIMLCAE